MSQLTIPCYYILCSYCRHFEKHSRVSSITDEDRIISDFMKELQTRQEEIESNLAGRGSKKNTSASNGGVDNTEGV